jgi:circadian clock protein KaiC
MSALLQIFQLCKVNGVTLLLPCILSNADVDTASSDIHASTVADVWIDLSYLVRAGERNRLLTVVKARGTAHSNQVRELLLSDAGIELTTPYTEEGEVLAGTLRWQKEQRAHEARLSAAESEARDAREFEQATAELADRIGALQRELESRNTSAQELASRHRATEVVDGDRLASLRDRRGGVTAAATAASSQPRTRRRNAKDVSGSAL